jgi:hypothetical protein
MPETPLTPSLSLSTQVRLPVPVFRANTTMVPVWMFGKLAQTTYTCAPSGLTTTSYESASPTMPPALLKWDSTKVSFPVPALRAKTATAFRPATYTCAPSGLTATPRASSRPSTPPTPSICDSTKLSAPSEGARVKAVTAFRPVTYAWAPSGLNAIRSAPRGPPAGPAKSSSRAAARAGAGSRSSSGSGSSSAVEARCIASPPTDRLPGERDTPPAPARCAPGTGSPACHA